MLRQMPKSPSRIWVFSECNLDRNNLLMPNARWFIDFDELKRTNEMPSLEYFLGILFRNINLLIYYKYITSFFKYDVT